MGEINNAGEEEVIDQTENGNDNQDESQKDVTTEEKGDSDQVDQEEQSNEEDKTDSDEKPALADEEPKTRKRNIDFILERKNRKIEKLQEKGSVEDNEEEDDYVDPDAQKLVQKEIQKALSPFLQKQIEEEDANEINSFLQENPDFKPYADKVRKFAQHESRKHLPIKSIFYEVAGPDLLKIGADRAKRAGDEAKETNAGGGSGDTSTAEKSVWELTPEEFAAKQEEIRNRPRP